MEFTFSRLQPGHEARYRAIRLECLRDFPYNFGANYAEQAALPRLKMEDDIAQPNEEAFVMGAWEGDALIGICGLIRQPTRHRRHIGTIVQMYVQPAYSGKRVGLRLLQATVEEAWRIPALHQLVLEVVTSSPHAIYMYGQAGFEQFGFHRSFLKFEDREEDALLMVLFRDKKV